MEESISNGGKGVHVSLSEPQKQRCINGVIIVSKKYIGGAIDVKVRVNISLRLWSGCIKAAKNIASETLSGPNSTVNGRSHDE
jgi:hypothetical protein